MLGADTSSCRLRPGGGAARPECLGNLEVRRVASRGLSTIGISGMRLFDGAVQRLVRCPEDAQG